MKMRLVVLIAAFCFGLSALAHADPITWNLVNVQFSDGGTAAGYIVFNATNRTVLDFDVHVTGGSNLDSFEYTPLNSGVGLNGTHTSFGAFSLDALTETRQFYLEVIGLFNVPATFNLDVGSFERCYTGPCEVGLRTVQGQLTATPEPWGLALLGSVMLLLPRLRPFLLRP